MQKVKVESMLIGKIEDWVLLKPDVAENYDTPAVRGYAFHFENGETLSEAFKMCEFLAKISKDNMNGWAMSIGSVGDSDALIFIDEFSHECYTFTFYEYDTKTAYELANRYRELAESDGDGGEDDKLFG